MRNDARPIGHEHSHQSPVVSHQSEVISRQPEVITHQSEVINQSGGTRRRSQSTVEGRLRDLLDLGGDDSVMQADESTLKIRI